MFGGTARNAGLVSVGGGTSATYSTTHQVGTHALSLTGSSETVGGYATIPSLQTLAPNAVTIACWVYVKSNLDWQRVLDLGINASNPQIYMFLTTNQASTATPSVRFAITKAGNGSEQQINMSSPATLSTSTWHHIAVVLAAGSPYTGTLYIDGAVKGTNTAMTLHPTDLGATNGNYLGKSAFPDSYFNGEIDDFRVYRRALTQTEITTVYGLR
jgi:hypothetical protein